MERAAAVLLNGRERGCRDIASAADPRRNRDAVIEMAAAAGPTPAVPSMPDSHMPYGHAKRRWGGGGAEGWGVKELR